MLSLRRPIALLCLTFVLFAALVPACGVLCVVFAPLFLFVAMLAVIPGRRDPENCSPQLAPYLSLVASRAPPLAHSC